MRTRIRYGGSQGRPERVATATTRPAPLDSARDYWAGIVIGYLAAVLTSVGVMLMFMRHGW